MKDKLAWPSRFLIIMREICVFMCCQCLVSKSCVCVVLQWLKGCGVANDFQIYSFCDACQALTHVEPWDCLFLRFGSPPRASPNCGRAVWRARARWPQLDGINGGRSEGFGGGWRDREVERGWRVRWLVYGLEGWRARWAAVGPWLSVCHTHIWLLSCCLPAAAGLE